MVSVKGLWKKYNRDWVLKDINMEVSKGEAVAIVGPNGAGKSTLLKIIVGILMPDRGEVKLFGQEPQKVRALVGYAGENGGLRETATVYGEMLSYCTLKGCDKSEITELLTLFGLRNCAKMSVKALSQGIKQRLALARSLLGDPKLVVWDEPFRGLDTQWKERLSKIIKQLKEDNVSFIISFHSLDEATLYADKAIVLEEGTVKKIVNLNKITNTLRVKIVTPSKVMERVIDRKDLDRVIGEIKSNIVKAEVVQMW